MDMARAKAIGFETVVSLEAGIAETMEWYADNRAAADRRYNPFTETALAPKDGA